MGLGTVLARRAVMLTVALVIVVFLTTVIMGATGYDKMVWEAKINEEVRAYRMGLQQHKAPPSPAGRSALEGITAMDEVRSETSRLIETNLQGFDPESYINLVKTSMETAKEKALEIYEFAQSMQPRADWERAAKDRLLKNAEKINTTASRVLENLPILEQAVNSGDKRTIKATLISIGSSAETITNNFNAVIQAEVDRLVEIYRQQRRATYKLDEPWYVRMIPLAVNTLKLDLGEVTGDSVPNVAGKPKPLSVAEAIKLTLPRTIVMITIAQAICAAVALLIGPYIAYKHGSLADRITVSYAALTNAIPIWWLGMVFIFIFGYELGIFPTNYRGVITAIKNFGKDPITNFKEILWYATLPIVTIIITVLGSWLYSVRAMLLRVVREDFVTVAKAKGLPERLIQRRHVLRTAAPPVLTSVILALAGSIGGYIITESIFDWPGMGSLYFAAIMDSDVPTILGLTYILTLVYIVARFILEVLYILLDPRVRYR